MKVIIQIGIKRSGNHGILNLIKKSGIKNYIHMNDIHHFTYENYEYFSKKEPEYNPINDHNWTGFKGVDIVIISLENKCIPEKELEKFHNISNIHFIVLLRNPFNNAASAYKYFIANQCNSSVILLKYIMTIWKQYANFFLKSNTKYNLIIYDKFYKNKKYRETIFEKLGLKYNEEYLNEINGWGRSFFDLNATNTNNQKIFERWKVFENDTLFKKNVMDDKELHDLWGKICEKFEINENLEKH